VTFCCHIARHVCSRERDLGMHRTVDEWPGAIAISVVVVVA